MPGVTYPLDVTGLSPGNLITNEIHVLTEINADTYRILIPDFSPFYVDNFQLKHIDSLGNATILNEGVDYNFSLPYIGGTRSIGKMLYGGISIVSELIDGVLAVNYQTLGGSWIGDSKIVLQTLSEHLYNPRIINWDLVTNIQAVFPPINHDDHMDQLYGHQQLIDAINALGVVLASNPNPNANFIAHLLDLNNPHEVTKQQVGLSNVANLPIASDADIANHNAVNKYVTLSQVLQLISAMSSGGSGGGGTTILQGLTVEQIIANPELSYLFKN